MGSYGAATLKYTVRLCSEETIQMNKVTTDRVNKKDIEKLLK